MTPQRRKPRLHPRVRTWTLSTLDRGTDYLLFFHQGTQSWEVTAIDRGSTVVTRPEVQQRRSVKAGDATKGAQRRGLSQASPSSALAEDA